MTAEVVNPIDPMTLLTYFLHPLDDDNDFDFEQGDSNKRNNEGGDENTQKIDNHHYDEAVELSDEGSGITIIMVLILILLH